MKTLYSHWFVAAPQQNLWIIQVLRRLRPTEESRLCWQKRFNISFLFINLAEFTVSFTQSAKTLNAEFCGGVWKWKSMLMKKLFNWAFVFSNTFWFSQLFYWTVILLVSTCLFVRCFQKLIRRFVLRSHIIQVSSFILLPCHFQIWTQWSSVIIWRSRALLTLELYIIGLISLSALAFSHRHVQLRLLILTTNSFRRDRQCETTGCERKPYVCFVTEYRDL